MPTLQKLLSKFRDKERKLLIALIEKIISLNWQGLDIKKLKGHPSFFRLRKGDLRIIFQVDKKNVYIIAIERRSEKTYRDY